MKGYAFKLGPLVSLDRKYIGFTVADNGKTIAWMVYLLPTLSLAVIASILIIVIVHTKWGIEHVKLLYRPTSEQESTENSDTKPWKYYSILIRTSCVIVFFINIVDCVFEAARTFTLFNSEIAWRQILLTVFTLICPLILAYFVSVRTGRKIGEPIEWYSRCLLKRTFFFWNFGILLYYIIFNILPIVILLFINPIRTIALVSLAITLLLSYGLLLAIYAALFSFPLATGRVWTRRRIYKRRVSFGALIIVLGVCSLIIVTPILYVYLMVIKKGVNTGGVLGIMIALIPTIITVSATWFGKRTLKNTKGLGVARLIKLLTIRN